MTLKEFAKKGGKTTFKKYGTAHYSDIGSKGAQSLKALHGEEYFVNLSKLGVAARKLASEKRAAEKKRKALQP